MAHVGLIGIGVYLPENTVSNVEISERTGGVWSPEAVKEKLGINQKYEATQKEGTQIMGAWAAQKAIEDAGISADDIDVILCISDEWKEHPLTTSAMVVQDYIGANNAWGIDVQNRCSTTISAMKMAKDMILGSDDIETVLIAGGYRNGDLIDYTEKDSSMFFDLSAGGGAFILQKNARKNVLLGSKIISDGSVAHYAGVEIGGINQPATKDNVEEAYHSLKLMNAPELKAMLNTKSMDNWMLCIDEALAKSDLTRDDIDYLNILHIKRSGHLDMLNRLNLTEDQSVYLEDYGHVGQIDQMISMQLGLEQGKIQDGSVVCTIAAGIGYAWAANVIIWGPYHE